MHSKYYKLNGKYSLAVNKKYFSVTSLFNIIQKNILIISEVNKELILSVITI